MKITLKVDSRRRVTIPKATPGDVFQFEILETGQIMLIPVALIPKHKIERGITIEDNQPCLILHGAKL